LEKLEEAEGKSAVETQMILNRKHAIELLIDEEGRKGIQDRTIFTLHAQLAKQFLGYGDIGRFRNEPVWIKKSNYRPLETSKELSLYFNQIMYLVNEIKNPFEACFFLLVHLSYLQPFIDVNKRVSRLAANIPLIQSNYFPLTFTDVPQSIYTDGILAVYELNRIEVLRDVFVWAYGRSVDLYQSKRTGFGV
jgi:Fic family protein